MGGGGGASCNKLHGASCYTNKLINFVESVRPKKAIPDSATERLNFRKTYSKIFVSEAIRGMKLKLCVNVHGISLYKNCIFIVVAHVLSLLWQLKVSIYL